METASGHWKCYANIQRLGKQRAAAFQCQAAQASAAAGAGRGLSGHGLVGHPEALATGAALVSIGVAKLEAAADEGITVRGGG